MQYRSIVGPAVPAGHGDAVKRESARTAGPTVVDTSIGFILQAKELLARLADQQDALVLAVGE